MAISFFKRDLYGEYILAHRTQYLLMFLIAVSYIILLFHYKKKPKARLMLMKVANPVFTALFMAWSVFLTYNEYCSAGKMDTTVYIAVSLSVPICFFISDAEYALITLVCDAIMMCSYLMIGKDFGAMLNFAIIIVLRSIMCIAFLRLRYRFASRVIEEKTNADYDVMTGFFSRRYYQNDLTELSGSEDSKWVYVSVDINGLKEVNDQFGHEAGDELIKGAASCMQEAFGSSGKYYRIGGDEFAMILPIDNDEYEKRINAFEMAMNAWSDNHRMKLSMSYGFVSNSERNGSNIHEMTLLADQRMYEAKAEFYRKNGMERRNVSR
ncbi:MAG: GGDEF domain-containing protein [Lachnospiraceae bacterium]|nr:GGDEF domain-containing protein [Lachnospiraceae bacterium]